MYDGELEYVTAYIGGVMLTQIALVDLLDGAGLVSKQMVIDTLKPLLKKDDPNTNPALEAIETFLDGLEGNLDVVKTTKPDWLRYVIQGKKAKRP